MQRESVERGAHNFVIQSSSTEGCNLRSLVDKPRAAAYNQKDEEAGKVDDMAEQLLCEGVMELTAQLREIYAAFDQNLAGLSRGDNAGQAFGNQLRSWIGAGGYKQQADKACAEFGRAVKTQIEKLCTALETAPEEEARAACAKAAEIMLVPMHASDGKSLMLRAVAPYIAPLLKWFDRETLLLRYEEFQKAYPKKVRLPAEKTFLREMEQQLKHMDGP